MVRFSVIRYCFRCIILRYLLVYERYSGYSHKPILKPLNTMDTTEMYIKIDDATHEFRKLQHLVSIQSIFEIPRLVEQIDGQLWAIKDAYGYVVSWEPEFRTIIKKYVDITDIKVN
jgi:hypothetical protein